MLLSRLSYFLNNYLYAIVYSVTHSPEEKNEFEHRKTFES